jgi:hypothetical protein
MVFNSMRAIFVCACERKDKKKIFVRIVNHKLLQKVIRDDILKDVFSVDFFSEIYI